MILHFIRHGQTKYNKDGLVSGHTDIPLDEEGIIQAKNAAAQVPPNCAEIYSSDLIRCKQTALILNEKLGLHITYDVRLRERHFGSLEGKSWEEIDLEIREKDKRQEYDYRTTGGESFEDVKKRVLSFIEDIRKKWKGETILVVTSAGIIRLLHHILTGKSHEKIHNSSVHEFEFPDTA